MPFIAGFLVVVGLLLDATPQGQDLAETAAESTVQGVWLFVSAAALGIEAWFWTRQIINENCGLVRGAWPSGAVLTWTPRGLGIAPFVFGAIAVFPAGLQGERLAGGLLVAGAVLFWALVRRTVWMRTLRNSHGRPMFSDRTLGRTAQAFAHLSFLVALLLLVVVSIDPVTGPEWVGPIAVVYLGVAGMIPVIARALHWGLAWRAPVLTGLVIYLFVVSGWLDNHEVARRAFFRDPGVAPVDSAARTTIAEAFDTWYAQAPRPTGGGPIPIIFVAAEGGASRAGYWAAENLGLLQEKSEIRGRFASSLFAISSVSGGSVGAAAFISQLHDNPTPGGPGFAEAIKAVSSYDFLSPVLAGLLFPDLLQRAIPIAVLPDRAEALERAFEQGWTRHCAAIDPCDPDLWRKPFLNLWTGSSRWAPALLINGSRQEDGRRVITSNLIIDPNVFSNSVDFYDLVGHDIPISSAIHNGARFPLVSPGGTLVTPRGREGHIVDGGYIDGHGLLTLRQLASAVLAIGRAQGVALRPIIIELNNDSDTPSNSAELNRGFYSPASAKSLNESSTKLFGADVLGPLDGLFNAASELGTTEAVAFSREIELASTPDSVRSGAAPAPGAVHGAGALAALNKQSRSDSVWGVNPTYRILHLCKVLSGKQWRGMAMDWAVSHVSKLVSVKASGYDRDGEDPCSNRKTVKQIEADYGSAR